MTYIYHIYLPSSASASQLFIDTQMPSHDLKVNIKYLLNIHILVTVNKWTLGTLNTVANQSYPVLLIFNIILNLVLFSIIYHLILKLLISMTFTHGITSLDMYFLFSFQSLLNYKRARKLRVWLFWCLIIIGNNFVFQNQVWPRVETNCTVYLES
jgi:hypothetical protein